MTNYFDILKRVFQEEVLKQVPHPTRAQARKLVFDAIEPLLRNEGFTYKKSNNFWRITDVKTDVIELRFLLNNDPSVSNLPSSTFSILASCYFNFIPNPFDVKLIQQIPNITTPYETHCHLRFIAEPLFFQPIFKENTKWWHLDCDDIEVSKVLNDVQGALKNNILPLMKKFNNVNELLDLLMNESNSGLNLGIGKPNSFDRHYLLGFTYLKLRKRKLALQHLNKAKVLLDQILVRVNKNKPKALSSEAPIIKQSHIIIQALKSIETMVEEEGD